MTGLIYNQHDIPKDVYRYGLRPSAQTGCGWIATYNALRLMGYEADAQALIRYYQRQLPLIHGNGGTTIQGPAFFFRHHGFAVETLSVVDRFDGAVKNADVAILFYYWHRKYRFGAHFVTVQYNDGKFTGYNTFRSSTGPDNYGESLQDFLKSQRFFGSFLIAIKDKPGR